MRFRNTLFLTGLLILLAGYLYFFEIPKGEKEKGKTLLNFSADEVQRLALAYPRQEIQIAKNSSGKWQIINPLQAPADESTVSSVLSTLKTSEVKRTVEEKPAPADLKAFGLDPPAVKVSVSLKSGITLPSISVGSKTPVGDSAYVKRENETAVLLTSASLSSSLERKLSDFRDKRIIEIKEDSITQLTLSGSKGEFILSKKGQDWFLDKPKAYRADSFVVQGIFSTLGNMSARDFIDETPASAKKYGLDKPRAQLTISMGNEGQRELRFGDKREGKDEVYVAADFSGTIYTVQESVLKDLDKDLTELRDKQILSFPKDKLARLTVQTPQESWTLVKGEKQEWSIAAPKPAKAKQGAVNGFVTALGLLRAKGFAEDQPKDLRKYGLAPPSLKISQADKDGKALGSLLLGKTANGGYDEKSEEEAAVFVIDESSYNQLNKRLSDFVEEQKKESQTPSKPK